MKITIDTETNTVKLGRKTFDELDKVNQNIVAMELVNFLTKNTKLSDYDEDCMWMSYRYCIGRHTIAAHTHAGDIASHCYRRMSHERSIFTAYDINREIEQQMQFGKGPEWHFPITSLNRIYTSAIDIFCQFIEDFNIKSKEDYLKYYKIDVILADNERGYKIETTTWEEYLRPQVHKIVSEFYHNDAMSADYAWQYFEKWDNNEDDFGKLGAQFHELTRHCTKPDYFYFHDIEDLFVWNNLVHLFDLEHHHKSVLINGDEVEWYWTYTNDSEQREDGYWYLKEVGYKKIRVPVDAKIGSVTTWIPDENIIKDLY